MKTRIFKFMAVMVALTMAACTDYPDEWGFEVKQGTCTQNWQNATLDAYDVMLKTTFDVVMDGAGIENVRIELFSGNELLETFDADVSRAGNTIEASYVAQKLQYNHSYHAVFYAVNGDIVYKLGEISDFQYTKDILKPTFNVSLVMSGSHCIKVLIENDAIVEEAAKTTFTVKFANQTKTPVKDASGMLYVEFDLYELPINDTPYEGVVVAGKNVVGENSQYINYKVSVSAATQYSNDGDKGDCVRIGGIDWAKGSLTSNGTILENPTEQFEHGIETWTLSNVGTALAKLGNAWSLPTKADFERLTNVSSSQWCRNGMLYALPKNGKRFVSYSEVNLEKLPSEAIYLAANENNEGHVLVKDYGCFVYGPTENKISFRDYSCSVCPVKKATSLPDKDYVDLGFDRLWATCNVGASYPWEYGTYFAWGETKGKTRYDWSNYKWCNGSENTLTKYNSNSRVGTVDNKSVLEDLDDAAYVNLGNQWCMPYSIDFVFLTRYCNWTWITLNGVNGYEVHSRRNINSIFLPAGGYRGSSSIYDGGSKGYYWSQELKSNHHGALALYFHSSHVDDDGWDYRFNGFSVRAIRAQSQ